MAGDRGLALVVIGLMAISLTSIIEARIPRDSKPGIVAVSQQTTIASADDSLSRELYLDSQLKGFTGHRPYLGARRVRTIIGKRETLLWNPNLADDSVTPTSITTDDIEGSRLFEFTKPVE